MPIVVILLFKLYNAGYLYCAEMMPKEHELQLMLVNTLRKVLLAHLISVAINFDR